MLCHKQSSKALTPSWVVFKPSSIIQFVFPAICILYDYHVTRCSGTLIHIILLVADFYGAERNCALTHALLLHDWCLAGSNRISVHTFFLHDRHIDWYRCGYIQIVLRVHHCARWRRWVVFAWRLVKTKQSIGPISSGQVNLQRGLCRWYNDDFFGRILDVVLLVRFMFLLFLLSVVSYVSIEIENTVRIDFEAKCFLSWNSLGQFTFVLDSYISRVFISAFVIQRKRWQVWRATYFRCSKTSKDSCFWVV